MYDETQLIKNAQNGDIKAFETLVKHYDKLVLNIAYNYQSNKYDADDIYQEVFLKVFKGIKNFEHKSKFSTWLYRVTVNVCYEYMRKTKTYDSKFQKTDEYNNYELSQPKNAMDANSKLINSELGELINSEVQKLPKQLKMAFSLKHYQGMKIKEIAEIMECTEGTIKSYLFTASRKLRTKLKPILEK